MDRLATVCRGTEVVHLGFAPWFPTGELFDWTTHDTRCPLWCEARPGGATSAPPTVTPGASSVDRDCIVLNRHMDVNMVPVHPARQTRVAEYVRDADTPGTDRTTAEAGIRALLRLMGEDPARPGLAVTPARVVDAYLEMTDRPGQVAQLLARQFDDGPKDGEMVTVRGVEFVSICEHHLLPFTGTATVAYIPAGERIVGLSKLPRLVHHLARRPQVQERLTGQVTAALDEHLDTKGAACRIEATHMCMSLRGVRAAGAAMVTTSLTGRFLENDATRAEFLGEARR